MQQCPFMSTLDAAAAKPLPGLRYSGYLQLDSLLDSQAPLSGTHDEMLFIIQHQTSELWMKLLLHELTHACDQLRASQLPQASKTVARAQRTMEHLVHGWNVLATLTPVEFLAMRPALGSASGHQSFQFREIEFLLGNKNAALIGDHDAHPVARDALLTRLHAPSLYDEVVGALARAGFAISRARLDADPAAPIRYDVSVEAAWCAVYRDADAHWPLYDLGERLIDLEEGVRQWRFRHIGTVERTIGLRRGTGGSDGASYLRRTLDVVLFPELWQMRTAL
ncbi:tryptophan 2,3-dioxygenase [Burkholderia pyrrocinia]|uniref:tryptophan 2,3-dioxygenase n=1 Tax=Burkholderia pyrrocinia TaxID=60550 RepID=UPI001576DAC3|nr:tryptophan 2,3-dioxygenase family protein [Burkholderia pyrrocinia]NTX31835.1 tryptophan 2,3-dioxygenase [Burkholderia pyrrocinia]